MVIESLTIDTDSEQGDHLTVSGRSLESILDRRVIWNYTELSGNLQNGIEKLLNENVINPSVADRKIANLIFKTSTDTHVTSIEIEAAQYLGENLYDTIKSLCELYGLGFRLLPNFETKNFEFELYNGIDRSWAQNERPWVAFTPSYDNLLNSNYVEANTQLKSVARIAGDGEGAETKLTDISIEGGVTSGLQRRETYVDAGISSYHSEEEEWDETKYYNELKQKGKEELAGLQLTTAFDGELDARSSQFDFGVDYYLGDVVSVQNKYGLEAQCRVAEMVMTHDTSGEIMLPTFVVVQPK